MNGPSLIFIDFSNSYYPRLAQFSTLQHTLGSLALKKSLNHLLEFSALVRFMQKSALQRTCALPSMGHLSSFLCPKRAGSEPPLENDLLNYLVACCNELVAFCNELVACCSCFSSFVCCFTLQRACSDPVFLFFFLDLHWVFLSALIQIKD